MLTVEEALEKVLTGVNTLETEEKPILECQGQVLAENVYAGIDIPQADNSAMDGFAVRAEDTRGASPDSPINFKVIETVTAGDVPKKKVEPGKAVRIMTGAIIPEGADCVVKFEDTDAEKRDKTAAEVAIMREAKTGQDIRKFGEDIHKGSLVINSGTVLKPAYAGILASLGKSKVKVLRRPKVAVLATGNELAEVDEKTLPPGKLYNSNSYSVAAQVLFYGGIPHVLGIARDRADLLVKKLRQGLDADMLITTGGVSLGDYDIVRDVLAKEGNVSFWSVRMKPGKPIAFGTFQSGNKIVPHLGLPGNPVSAMVAFEIFARPAIMKMMGKTRLGNLFVEAVMEDSLDNKDGRRVFARVTLKKTGDKLLARSSGPQGSGILTSMAIADGLAVIPEDRRSVKPGDKVKVIVPDWNCGNVYV